MSGGRHEGFSYPAALGRADRDVLQIGVVARQTPCDGHGLRIVRVHAAGARQGELGEFVGVGSLELGQSPVLQNLGGQRVVLGQFLQHFFIGAARAGGGLLDDGQAQLVEEDLAELLGAGEVERLAGDDVGLLLQRDDALAEFVALRGQRGRVDQNTVAFDAVERLTAGHLQLVDEFQLLVGLQLRPQRQVHVQCLVAVLARVLSRLGHIDLRKRNLVRTLAAQVFIVDALPAQVALRQTGQPMRLVHFQHIALQHGVVRVALNLDAVVGKHMAVVLHMLAKLLAAAVFQPGFEPCDHFVERQLHRCIGAAVAQRNVSCFAGLHTEADAHDLGAHFVERSGLGVDGHEVGRLHTGEPVVKQRPVQDGVVLQVGGLRGAAQVGFVEQSRRSIGGAGLVLLDQLGRHIVL